jgi:hypothetical protein
MQEFRCGRVDQEIDELAINFGVKDFRRQVGEGSIKPHRAITQAEIQNCFVGAAEEDKGEIGRNVQVRQSQCDQIVWSKN